MRTLLKAVTTLAVVAAAALLGSLGATAAGLGGPPEEVPAPDPTMIPGSATIESRTADPAGGPAWAARVYMAVSGQTCTDFGREVDGKIGQLDGGGRFRARIPDDAGGNCGNPDAAAGLLLALDFYPDDPTTTEVESPRAIVHGVGGSRVREVSVHWPDGVAQPKLSQRRAFISVYSGAPVSVPVTVGYADGHEETFDLNLPR